VLRFIDLLRTQQVPTAKTAAVGRNTRRFSPLPSEYGVGIPAREQTSPISGTEKKEAAATKVPVPVGGEAAERRPRSEPPAPAAAAEKKSGHDWLDRCVSLVLEIFRAAAKGVPANIEPLAAHIHLLLRSLAKKPQNVDLLELAISRRERRIRGAAPDLGDLIEKAITMMLYAVKMGLHLQLQGEELQALIVSAMLHHIGMARVPAFIRLKQEKLKESERGLINQAIRQGASYLRSCGITDQSILDTVEQARERFDGSGDPSGLKGNEISPFARIVGLLSMFEALIHFRPYRRRLLPRDAIRQLIVEHKNAFDPQMLKALIESVSLYPVGTYVQLNTGDIGQVIRVHRRLPLRPIIRLASDRHGNSIKPRDVDLQKQPNLQVEHCMYPEELAAQEHRD